MSPAHKVLQQRYLEDVLFFATSLNGSLSVRYAPAQVAFDPQSGRISDCPHQFAIQNAWMVSCREIPNGILEPHAVRKVTA
jgi:hypothetical protein